MSKAKILTITISLLVVLWLACNTVEPPAQDSQLTLTEEGWRAFLLNDMDTAEESFNDAIVEDASYVDAYNGLGWVSLKNEEYGTAVTHFYRAITIDSTVVSVLVGLAYTDFYYTNPDQDDADYGKPYYTDAAEYAEAAIVHAGAAWNWNDECADPTNFPNNRDGSLSLFDIHMLAAMCYFNLADMPNTLVHINAMRVLIGESGDFNATTWDEIVAELDRLAGLDPTP